MIYVTDDRWTCPHDSCGQTVVGNSRARATQRRAHGVRHAREDGRPAPDLFPPPPQPEPPAELVIPKAPRVRRTRR